MGNGELRVMVAFHGDGGEGKKKKEIKENEEDHRKKCGGWGVCFAVHISMIPMFKQRI